MIKDFSVDISVEEKGFYWSKEFIKILISDKQNKLTVILNTAYYIKQYKILYKYFKHNFMYFFHFMKLKTVYEKIIFCYSVVYTN